MIRKPNIFSFKRFYVGMTILFSTHPYTVSADLIPTGNNPFYYQMGGGQDVPVAAYSGTTSIPLHVDADVGLGYNCGLFNPKLSITNSLNAVESSFQNIAKDNGNNGVPWVHGENIGRNGFYAGGQGQPPITVIYISLSKKVVLTSLQT